MLTARERDRAIRRWESSSIGASSSSLGLEDEDEDEGEFDAPRGIHRRRRERRCPRCPPARGTYR